MSLVLVLAAGSFVLSCLCALVIRGALRQVRELESRVRDLDVRLRAALYAQPGADDVTRRPRGYRRPPQ